MSQHEASLNNVLTLSHCKFEMIVDDNSNDIIYEGFCLFNVFFLGGCDTKKPPVHVKYIDIMTPSLKHC